MVECPHSTCDRDDFDTKGAMRSHHAQVHGYSISQVRGLECHWCGSKLKPRYEGHVSERNFCHDSDCEAEWQSEKMQENNPMESEEARRKMGETQSKKLQGHEYWGPEKHTEETKQQISESVKKTKSRK